MTQRASLDRRRSATVESLESRRLLSASVDVESSGVLRVIGTEGDDRLEVNSSEVRLNGQIYDIHSGQYHSIHFDALGGDDTATLSSEVETTPVTMIGGDGDDDLFNGF